MDPRWPRLPHPTVAWSAADDDDLDRGGYVVSGTEASLEWHEAQELNEPHAFHQVTPDGFWRESEADRRLFSEARSSW